MLVQETGTRCDCAVVVVVYVMSLMRFIDCEDGEAVGMDVVVLTLRDCESR
jgi:hypothetical protein